MSTVITPRQQSAPTLNGLLEDGQHDRFEALCRLIRRGQGHFSLALVEFNLPRVRDEILGKLQDRFHELNLVTVALTPPPPDAPRTLHVLDQLTELVETTSPERKPDAIIVTGYETLLPAASDSSNAQAREQLARAIQPLNLGRNILAETFPCPILLCLPTSAMALFLQSAPDLNSWRSGFFQFQADLDAVRAELTREAQASLGWWARWRLFRRAPRELHTEALRFEALIADAEALPAQKTITARLYERLGWVSVTLGDRTRARWAFAEMLRLAREAEDRALTRTAERGKQEAERVPVRTQAAPPQAAAREVFRGAAAVTEAEGLYGREEELRRLVGQVVPLDSRFLIVWGETGCGKSSLVQAGLVPELRRLGRYSPVIVRQWDKPETDIWNALHAELMESFGMDVFLDPLASLHDRIGHVAQHTGKTVVVVCDQFEQFFAAHPQRSERELFLKMVGNCVNDYRVPCKFIFVVREDQLGRLAEFDDHVADALERHKRFFLPLFSVTDAVRVLKQMSDKAALGWSDAFIRLVVNDLTRDGRVRPVELQLVGAALAAAGIVDDLDYARAAGAQGLLGDYLQLTLNNLYDFANLLEVAVRGRVADSWLVRVSKVLQMLQDAAVPGYPQFLATYWKTTMRRRLVSQTKRLLLTLVGDPQGRLALTPQEIARRTGFSIGFVKITLLRIEEALLVRRVGDHTRDEALSDQPAPIVAGVSDSSVRYELTHDILAELVLQITRNLQDQRRQANRTLQRALEDVTVNPRCVIGLNNWWLIRRHAGEEEIGKQQAKTLLRRSFLWGGFKWFVLPLTTLTGILIAIQLSSGYVSFEQDYADRVVVRRGVRWLGFLPVLGDEPILDTGFTETDFQRQKRQQVNLRAHYEWFSRQSEILADEKFVDALSLVKQGTLRCQLGQVDKGLLTLEEALKSNNMGFSSDSPGANALIQVAQAKPALTEQVLRSLLNALRDSDSLEHSAAAGALGRVVEAKPALAEQVLQPLLNALRDKEPNMYSAAAEALGRVAQAKPALAEQVLQPLLNALRDSDSSEDSAATGALVQVVKAKPALAEQVLQPLLNALRDKDSSVRSAAAGAIDQVVKAKPQTAIKPLLNALRDKDSSVRSAAAGALVQVVKAKPAVAEQVLQPLLNALRDKDSSVRSAAAGALGGVVEAKPALAEQVLQPLLNALRDKDSSVRSAAAEAIVQVAKASKTAQGPVFKLIIDDSEGADSWQEQLLSSLSDVLVNLAEKEQDPAQFLLDHLRGRRSLIPGGDAHTYAAYRDVVAGALAQWLVKEPKVKTGQAKDEKMKSEKEQLKRRLEQMRDIDPQPHLRVAAWNVFVNVAVLRQ